jgi:hypothetical protein
MHDARLSTFEIADAGGNGLFSLFYFQNRRVNSSREESFSRQ